MATAKSTRPELPLRLKLMRLIGKQTWVPRGRDRLLRMIWHPDSGKSFPFVVDFFGFRYPGDLSQFIDWTVFCYGSYAAPELSILADLAVELRKSKPHVTFFDIGANVGHHTLFMAGMADNVIAFEPFPPLQGKIREKIETNQLTNVRIVPFALGDADSVQQYHPGGGSKPGTGTFAPSKKGRYKDAVELQIRRGDQVFSELSLPPIDLLKIDVEGFEPEVLRGLAQRIARDRPAILMEMSDRSRSGFGSEAGFRSCLWDGALLAGVVNGAGQRYRLARSTLAALSLSTKF